MTDITLTHTSKQNQQIYQRLKVALGLELRRQIFVAVCDDLALQTQLANQLDLELAHASRPVSSSVATQDHYPRFVTLTLDLSDPNPIAQISRWLHKNPPPFLATGRVPAPGFQILGVEQLTRQPAAVQWQFLDYLRAIERDLAKIESCLVLWLPRPWFHSVQQSAPEFWNLHTGFFEFVGDPTPIAAAHPITHDLQVMDEQINTLLDSNPTAEPGQSLTQHVDKLDIWDILTEDLAKLSDANAQDPVTLNSPDSGPSNHEVTSRQPQLEGPASTNGKLNGQSNGLGTTEAQNREYQLVPSAAATVKTAISADNPPLEEGTVREPQRTVLELSNLLTRKSEQPGLKQGTSVLPKTILSKPILPILTVPAQAAAAPLPPSVQPTVPQPGVPTWDYTPLSQEQIQTWQSLVREPVAQSLLERLILLQNQRANGLEVAVAGQNLANFYRDRIEQGEGSEQNLTLAIQLYEQVTIWLRQAPPEVVQPGTATGLSPYLPDILNDLGNLYWMFSRQLPDVDQKLAKLAKSIATYHAALENLDAKTQSLSYAMVYNNLGAAYGDLARYQDTADNLQRSIDAYQVALQHRRPEMDALKYASTQNNLGTAYWHLAQHEQPITHLKSAIAAYSEALQYYHPEQEPLNYAMIQNNLGTAYWNLAQYEQPDQLLELAIRAYQAALVYRTSDMVPTAHAATQNNLGTAYWHTAGRLKDNALARQDFLIKAIAAYTAAIQTAAQVTAPLTFDVFATQNNLGLACYQVATDQQFPLEKPQRSQYLDAALHHHLKALQGWQRQPEYYQTALGYVVQTIRGFYSELGLSGQNQALSKVPGHLLREILPKL